MDQDFLASGLLIDHGAALVTGDRQRKSFVECPLELLGIDHLKHVVVSLLGLGRGQPLGFLVRLSNPVFGFIDA